ncbi:MAG: SRPBCC family protein [Nitrospira sp.]|nr:SRPBCC family protein [Nitrospira sp.]
MRLWDKRRAVLPVVLCLLCGQNILSAFVAGLDNAWAAATDRLDVTTEPRGGVRARATVLFPANPATVRVLLTDYQHWPDLFETPMRVAEVNIHEGVATVDLRITHSVMPGEHRLVTESRALPNGVLSTDLKAGDFKRYHRVWTLQPVGDGTQTSAGFELVVEPAFMVPDWLVAMVTRQELETHFRLVKQKLLEQATR